MFYNLFKEIQTAVGIGAPALKAVQWFNMQYEATITQSPVAFVEFPDDSPADHASKDLTRLPVSIRVHVVSKVISSADGTIPDTAIQQAEALAASVRTALTGLKPPECKPLRFTGWRHWQRYQGFMITYVDFATMLT